MRAHDVDGDFEHDRRRGRTPTGRVYVHARCGGATRVGGGDYKRRKNHCDRCNAPAGMVSSSTGPAQEMR